MFKSSKINSARFLFCGTTLTSILGILLLLSHTAQAQLPPPTAQDTASDSAYTAWDDGDNGGFGMGPWTLNPASNTPQNGFFVGDSTGNNGTSNDPDGDINTVPGNRAWGLYANSGQTASAVRNFLAPFTPGSVFEIFMDNGAVQSGGTVGFALQNSSGQDLLEVYFVGGGTQYTVYGDTLIPSGVNFTREGVRVVITLTTASTYQATLTRLVDGAGNTVSGNLRNNPGPISQLRLFNADAGTSPDNDLFFNRITYYRGRVLNADTGRGYLNIQPAIDDPATLAGHTISVTAGLYTGTVTVRKPVAIVGAGPGQTIIQSLSPGIVVTTSNVTISNTSIVGTGSDVGITTTFGVTNLTVSNVHISNFAQGVALLGGHSHTVQNSVFTLTNATTSVGVGMIGLTTTLPITNVLVSGNVFTGSGYAVAGLFANQNAIVGNQMRYGTAGVRLAGANGNLIEGNQIENNSLYAIYLAPNVPFLIPPVLSNSNNVISGNVALNHLNDRAIQIINSSQPGNGNQIVNNVIQNAGQAGIFTGAGSGDTNLLIAGNTVITANPGIAVGSSVTATITNNQVSGGSSGIQIANSSNVVVISNTTSNNGDGIRIDNGSSHVTAANNAVSSAGNGMRVANSTAVTLTANKVTNSTTGFLVDSGSNAIVLLANQAQSLNTGIRVGSGATNVTLASNTVDGTGLSLELLQNSSHVVITGNTLINSGLGFSITNGAGNLVTATFNIITSTGGVLFNSGNASGLLLSRNNLANNTGITNTAAGTLNAECNWYGAANGPSGVGSGSGTPVSTGVDFNPWLLSDDLNGPCSGGSLTIQKVLVGPITPTTAWQFTATVPTGTLVFTLPAGGGAVTFSGLDFGQVSITETTKLDYIPTSSCTTGATGGASISFNLIGNVTCTFTNTITPATTVITVTPVITNGWFYITETVGPGTGLLPFDIVLPPPDPTLGEASARLTITNVNWRHMYLAPIFTGTRLSDITVFEYRLRRPSASSPLPYINIGWDDNVTDGNTGFRGRLVYSPPSLPANAWHIVDARNDPTPRWYTTLPGATQCTNVTPCTFTDLVAAYPNAAIHPNTLSGVPLGFIGIRVGGTGSTGTGYADGLRVGVGSQITLFDFEAASPTTITLAANPTTTVVGNNVLLTATVTIANGDPAADGTVVSFTSSLGNVSPVTATTVGGVVTATLNSTVAGVATVTATVNSLSTTAQVTFTPGAPFTLTLTAVPATLPVGNSSTLTATATDQYGNPVADGTTISFTTSLGALSSSTANTSGGDASVTLSSTVAGVATVTATIGSLSATAQVTFARVFNMNTGLGYVGIQQAIDDPQTLNGHTISVTAGIYTELVSVTKQLTLLGAQHGQDAVARTAAFVGGKADPTVESIIYTPINNPTGGNPGAADLFRVLTHNVTIDGFVFDGNNPALLTSTVQIEGVYAHARRGVTNIGPNDSFNPLNNLVLRNNVFQNFGQRGVSLANNGPLSVGNLIERNVLRRIHDQAIILFTNAYADIVSNTVKVPVGGIGLHLQNFSANNSMAWLSNTVTIITNALGIHANLFYAPSATLLIRGNMVNADAASALPSQAVWGWGINVWSIQQGSTVIVEGNRVGLSGGRLGRGINVWNVPTTNTVRVIGNIVANSTVGINFDNVDPYFGGGQSSTLLVTSNTITGTADGVGLRVRVSVLESDPLFGANAVSGHGLMLISDTTVVSAGVGLRVETGITSTFMASATLHNSALRNNGIGIQVLRGALTATHNYLLTNTLGVTNTGGASVDVWLNRNAIVGNGAGITNTAAGTLNAECNWYGAANGPSGVGSGSGDSVSTGVDFNPWLLSDNLNGPCSSGSLTIQKVLVGPITPTTAWQFTATVPTGTLVFTLPAGGGAVTFSGLDFGPATITETTKLGYIPTSSCTTGATGGASISFNLIGNVTCTFTNTITPATTVITVTPVITNGWFYITETVGPGAGLLPFDIVLSPPDPTLGKASARLVITDVNWRHMYLSPVFTGTRLSDITVFEYRLRIPSASSQVPYINIGWDDDVTDGDTGFRGRLVYSPPSLPADAWHIVDARNDPTPRWYTTLTGAPQCTSTTPCTFAQVVAAYPNAAIHPNVPLGFIGIRVGGVGSTGMGYADGLRVGVGSQVTLFDFEAASPTTVTLAANPTTTVVGNNVLLTATVTIANGDPAADGTTISFTTSLGGVSPVTATTVGGVATATLSSTVAGVATVTATVNSLSATTQVTFTAGAPFTLTLTAVPATLPVGNSSTLTATATDQYGNPVADGTTISFTTSLGALSSSTANTSGGDASVTLSSTVAGVATVTATIGSLSATAQVTFTAGAPFTLTLTAVPSTLPVGSSSALTATATDQYGNAVADGTVVSFTTSLGSVSPVTATTVGSVATATLSSTISGVATVTATVGSLSTTVQVTFTPGAPFTFTFTLTPTVIVANGISQSLATATVVDQFGNPVSGVTVNFLAGIGTFSPASGATNASGQITATLTSLTPAIENVFAVVSGLGFRSAQATYVNPPASSAPLTSTLQTVTQTLGVVRKGGLITYTLTVTNTGAGQINNVLLFAPIPSGTTYVAGSASGGNFSGSFAMLLTGQELGEGRFGPQAALNAVTWSGNLAAGAAHTLSYVVQVQILEGQVVNQPKVFVDNADTGMNLSSAVDVVAYKIYMPIVRRQ
jgi:parallel beta-helix repeat protein